MTVTPLNWFWDLDHTLYDFDSVFKTHMPHVTNAEDDSTWKWQELHAVCPEAYLIGNVMPGMLSVFAEAGLFGQNHILTAIPKRWSWPDCTKHKREWAVSFLPITRDRVRFGPYAEDKQHHCSGPWDVLIDDRLRNCEQWVSRGGLAIHHKDPDSTRFQIQAVYQNWNRAHAQRSL